MQQVVWISVVLLNVVWISFFLTPDLDFSVFVQRRSISSSDETFMMEFCLQPDSDRKWTSTGPSASGPDGDINTITERPVNGKGMTTEAAPAAKITVPKNQEINITQPVEQEVNRSPFRSGQGYGGARGANSSGPKECCFKFFRNIVNKNLIFSYYMTDSRCARRAVILITKKGRHICVDPNQLWVKKIIDFLDRKPFLLQPT
ncbi:uncharacterized protein LOC103480215 [Poecilia reticulata]|uniref:uncharacterized protein LOC103480215 n=1 Tax=Poecilia reticulata TaxID=8081 RepID=UPI0007EBDC5D|nr:PREDICTED: uncharacterized protein LOC103480215 [Poecilia reticulata]